LKKILIAAALVMSLAVVACDDGDDPTAEPTAEPTPVVTEAPAEAVEDAVTDEIADEAGVGAAEEAIVEDAIEEESTEEESPAAQLPFPHTRGRPDDPGGLTDSCPASGYSARIRLLRFSWVSSARPSASTSGGRYMPKRPR